MSRVIPRKILLIAIGDQEKSVITRKNFLAQGVERTAPENIKIGLQTISVTILNQTFSQRMDTFWQAISSSSEYSRLWQIELHSMKFLHGVDHDRFDRFVSSWIAQCPSYLGTYWHSSWNAYALSVRLVVWIKHYAGSPKESRYQLSEKVSRSLVSQLLFLERNLETDVPGNHLVKNCCALFWGSGFFEGKDAERWKKKAIALLGQIMATQILHDGVHFERSPSYHNQVLKDLIECWQLLEDSELKVQLAKKLKLMIQVAVDLTHPDGDISMLSDGCRKMAPTLNDILALAGAKQLSEPKPRSIFSYEVAGLSGWRDDGHYVLIDHGPIGPPQLPGHGHMDMFSFEWTVKGQRMIVDKGVYEYKGGEKRISSRSTLSHNTLSLSEEEQAEFWGEFRLGSVPKITSEAVLKEDKLIVHGHHYGFCRLKGKPIHHRQFEVTPTTITIRDSIQGGSDQSAEARFLIHPACRLVDSNDGMLIMCGNIAVDLITTYEIKVENVDWFPEFGRRDQCQQIQVKFGIGEGPWIITLKIREDI